MRKLFISCAALFLSCGASLFAQQTGVNTKNPQGAFHVDSKKNNSAVGTPTAAEVDDDLIVDNDGKVGVGILAPITRLHIKSATAGGIRIVDGRQGLGKLLVSDVSGVGTWVTPAVTRRAVKGVFPVPTTITNTSPFGGSPIYSGQSIVLGQGKWVVSAGITFESIPVSNTPQMGWVHAYLSTSTSAVQQNGFIHLGPAGNNTTYAGVLYGNFLTYEPAATKTSFISGNSLIEVPGTTPVTIYLLLEDFSYTYKTNAPQNYFYAVPVN
ncbi:hypothetical protein [Pedobacter chitinilyticus]|uniref:Uncharacterized protein n=1 Tax=Pedobacter chitinilyticus TaxID=2233776 RepID=A0A3S3ST67_9SPHI|nr:hypothetical protein [Pedobacter chitinilyticus]RWU05646.1 hypothetical protein DPV69_16015 [Pedobacter chitinilyticus]